MPNEVWILLAAVLPATVTGLLTYFSTKHRIQDDRSSALFDDSRDLTSDYKVAYKDAINDLSSLKDEIDCLRDEVTKVIAKGEMWRNVAVAAYLDHPGDPHWWPTGETPPLK